jgi:nickel/cobalt transporter (NiCoT) family protein
MTGIKVLKILNPRGGDVRVRVVSICGLLGISNIAAWTWALVAFRGSPILLGTAFLAYGFGLRHGFDPDHIAAVDNVTRKLMQEGKRPITVGLFFSLGHSTVVIALAAVVAFTTIPLADHYFAFKNMGGVIGSSISALFLSAIAAANVLVLAQVCAACQAAKRPGCVVQDDLDRILTQRGFLGRIFRRLFNIIEQSWHMYPLGILFGLGFDTASEVGLLGMSASQTSQGLAISSILIFPVLFTAGMSMVDTTDGILMLGAYGWAFVEPTRKLFYNLIITFVSVVAAMVVGTLETLGLIGEKLGLKGFVWAAVGTVSDNFGSLGYVIVVLFIVTWFAAVLTYRATGHHGFRVQVDVDGAM